MQPIRTLLSLCLALFCVSPAFAADVPRSAYTGDVEQLVVDGWVETSSGIYQRTVDGRQQTVAYGDAGPRLELGWLTQQIALLTESLEKSGSAEVATTLQELEARRDELIGNARSTVTRQSIDDLDLFEDVSGINETACGDIALTVSATAGAGNNGPTATATTSFSDVSGRSATVKCYTFARAYSGSVYGDGTESDGPRTVYGSGSCSVSKEVAGDNNCFATSDSQLQFQDDVGNLVTFFDRNSTQECAPLTVAINSLNGLGTVSIPYGSCKTLYYSASSNRATTAFAWNFDNIATASGSSFSRKFCNDLYTSSGYFASHTLTLTGTSGSQSATATSPISLFYEGGGSGGGECLPGEICPIDRNYPE